MLTAYSKQATINYQRKDLTTRNILFEDKTYVDEKGLSTENQLCNCETFYFKKIFLLKNTSIKENISIENVHNIFKKTSKITH